MNATTTVATAVVGGVLAVAFLAIGSAKIAAVPQMRERAAHLGFGVSAYRRIGAVEVAGAIGLFVGFVFPVIGIAAALGFVLLLGGAVLTHVRAGDNTKELAPALAVGVIAVASLVLFVIEATS